MKIHLKNAMRNVEELIPYANNARTHSAEQLKQIENSIKEFGFTNPILIDDAGMIVAGHGRVIAAKTLGIKELPCIILEGLTEVQKKAYILADNKIALNAGWDDDLLKMELANISEMKFDFSDLNLNFDIEDITDFNKELNLKRGSLSEKFGISPFSILNAREGWWQERKRAWIALGIKSELGRGCSPGGSPRPACDYSKKQRGDGTGRVI
jgi:hypothetical protein